MCKTIEVLKFCGLTCQETNKENVESQRELCPNQGRISPGSTKYKTFVIEYITVKKLHL